MTDPTIREEASRWFAALRRGVMSLEERARFDAWRAEPAHQRALDSMHELWGEVSAIKSLGAPIRRRRYRPSLVAAAAAAAAVLVIGVGGAVALLTTAPQAEAHIRTKIGEQQTRTLPDGSVVAVNVVTSLDYETRANLRSVRLNDGQATFFVKKNDRRPFVVRVGDYQLRATKTAFDVRLRDGVVDVAVGEGDVDIVALAGDRADAPVVRVPAGAHVQLAVRAASPGRTSPVAVKAEESQGFAEWRLRTVNYRDAPVSTVIEDLNRFYERPLEVRDSALAHRHVTIRLQVSDRDETLSTLAGLLGADIRPGDRSDVLGPKGASAGPG